MLLLLFSSVLALHLCPRTGTRDVGYLSMTTFSASSSTATELNLTSLSAWGPLHSMCHLCHFVPPWLVIWSKHCSSYKVNVLSTVKPYRYRHRVLLIHTGVSWCFHCFAPNTSSPAHWGVLLALQWNVTQWYLAYPHPPFLLWALESLPFSWPCLQHCEDSSDPSDKFFVSLCPLSCKMQCLAVCFSLWLLLFLFASLKETVIRKLNLHFNTCFNTSVAHLWQHFQSVLTRSSGFIWAFLS